MAKVRKPDGAGLKPKTIKLEKIRLDGDTQSRRELSDEVIKEYARLIQDGYDFPALDVMFDGVDYWLYDGFHRRFAAVKAKRDSFKCSVTNGTREDARWESYSANRDHGFNRGNDDKAKAVKAALLHPNGAKLSDRQIAVHVGVNHMTVGKYRGQLETTGEIRQSKERTGTDGRTINTTNIGKAAAEEPEPTGTDFDGSEFTQPGDAPDPEEPAAIAPAVKEKPVEKPKPSPLKELIEQATDKLVVARYLFDSCTEQQKSFVSVAWSDWWKD